MKKLEEKDFKEGLDVIANLSHYKNVKGKLHREDNKWFLCQNECDGYGCRDKLGFKYSWILDAFDWDNMYKYEKTLDNLEVGDIICYDYGKKKVLAILGSVIGVSISGCYDIFANWYTVQELKDEGYIVEGSTEIEEPVEMTIAEVAEKLGIDKSKLKIID